MHATTTSIAAIDAGRQAPPTASPTTPDSFTFQSANNTPVPQSPVQTAIRERSEARPKLANARRSTLKRVTWLMNMIIPIFGKPRATTETRSPNDSQDLTELRDAHQAACLVALQDENNKARLALKASIMPYCTSEQFDQVFPPSLQYISKALAEEISDKLWEELVSASERK